MLKDLDDNTRVTPSVAASSPALPVRTPPVAPLATVARSKPIPVPKPSGSHSAPAPACHVTHSVRQFEALLWRQRREARASSTAVEASQPAGVVEHLASPFA